jgi:hypothetical protein
MRGCEIFYFSSLDAMDSSTPNNQYCRVEKKKKKREMYGQSSKGVSAMKIQANMPALESVPRSLVETSSRVTFGDREYCRYAQSPRR